ncbi:hypothetical protein GN244_ATG01488 [Phytophthora infestans]|uniref:Uncharacterized protein n=1 Tax=Phytophthora infestans TaxID=4787 RepID=A0A833X215_PHYIN|nr:hypothetical protein GN244_ATG01488 [Phytophthora infestans]
MCSVENCTRKCYKATPCCWNHRGHVSKFTAVVKPVVESVPEIVVKPIVEPDSVVEAIAEPAVETIVEAVMPVVKPVVHSVAEAVVEPVLDRNLDYEYNYVHRGRQYEHWIKKHASGVGNHALEYIDCNFAIYEDDLDFLVTNRSRKMDGGVKLSTHIVTNIGFTVAELIKPFNSTFNTPFLLDTAADMAYTDHDLTNDLEIKSADKPQEIFAESSSEFIDKAIQKISKIPDYDPFKFDVYGRAPKGNFVYVKRTGSSYCSVCDRIHESDDTMLLIFNEKSNVLGGNVLMLLKKKKRFAGLDVEKMRSQLMRMRSHQKTLNPSLL